MQTKHIKSVSLVTDQATLWTKLDHGDPEKWYVIFEITQEFAKAFNAHMRATLHAADIYECGLAIEDFDTEQEWEMSASYSTGDAMWFIADDLLVREEYYDDQFERVISDDWWMSCIGLLKEVLKKTV